MKRAYNICMVIAVALLSYACTAEDTGSPHGNGDINLKFSVEVPEENIVSTRSEQIVPGQIESLYVLVFDEDGAFLSRAQATEGSAVGIYNVRLAPTDPAWPEEQKKRIIHFVCNYDWSSFSDAASVGKHEGEIISSMSVTGGAVAYWRRMELPGGISAGIFPNRIQLLRNVAKISVVNNTTQGGNLGISNIFFALGDYPDYGTIAPYDKKTFTYAEGSVVESPFATIQAVDESDFVDAGANSIICYERKNSTAQDPMYVILKGRYSGDSRDTYYKIDIVPDNQETLYDIERNYHYILRIDEVTGSGNAQLQDAVNSAASNNLVYSVIFEKYPSITDGISVMYVDKTAKTLVEPNKEFSIPFGYITNISTGAEENNYVEITVEQDPLNPIVDMASITVDRTSGAASFKARTVNALPEYDILTAKIIFRAERDGVLLRRVVQVNYRRPFEFGNFAQSPTVIPRAAGENVSFTFTIPDNIRTRIFPIEVFFRTKQLSPNAAAGYDSGLSLDYSIQGIYRYKYLVRSPGTYTVNFKTIATTTSEELIIESEMFSTVRVNLHN